VGQTLFVLTVLASWTGVGCDSPTGSNQKVPAELRLDPTDWAAVVVGSSVELTATFLDDDGEVIDPPPDGWPITWLSSDEAVASVADGVVTGVALGQTVITAAFGDLADEVAVYVEPVPTAEGLLLAIGVHPDTVAPGDPFRVTYTITNTTLVPVILTAASSCLAWVRVYFGGEPIGVDGLHHGCRAEITYWRIEGWREWRYSALAWVEYASATRWADSLPLDPGDYTIVFESQVLEINGEPAELPTISATLTVSP
jgi:hypothetical protein